ncbi:MULTISPECIES: type II secretion system F family protein [Alphaproteobacteria]|uniref:type II secretion system F family protein n=1 Tax=Alphaproteobacteria TaxID=28211 RepID=UPI003A919F84
MSEMVQVGVIILIVLGLSLLQLLLLRMMDQRARRHRLARSLSRQPKGQSTLGTPLSISARLVQGVIRVAAMTAERVSVVKGGEADASVALLKVAGIRSRDAHLVYAFLKLVMPIAGGVGALLWLFLNAAEGVNPLKAIAIVSAAALVLSRAPDAILIQKKKSRLERVRRGFPDMLELLVIASDSGLGPLPALKRVSREVYATCPDLALEMQQLVIELGVLPDRDQAWHNFEERLPLSEIAIFANAMVQSARFGTPFRAALRTLMMDTRAQRLLRLEEQAGRLPALMTVPLIFFIMPALFIVLIGPAVLSILDNLMSGGS